ncbi:MAG: hypothetical protein WCX71_04560 [Candidatus Buchananbacteria bacterium]
MTIKTPKSISKRVKFTNGKKKRKVMTKHGGQDHFNARESGNTTRHKRKDLNMTKTDLKNVKRLLPYS